MAKHSEGKRFKQENKHEKKINNVNNNITKNSSTKKKIKINIFLILFIALFIYSAFILCRWIWSNFSAKQANERLKEEVVEVAMADDRQEEKKLEEENSVFNKINFTKLKEINADVVGYIEVPNTNISYPILQADDNDYYLNKDIYKKYNGCGSVFMDYTNNPNFTDSNTVLFGHNLITGMMFTDLNKIVDGELGNNIVINIYTEKANYQYKMFSTYISKPIKEPINTQIADIQGFINTAIQKSNVSCNTYPTDKDKILTLSTCNGSGKNRTIVHGVKILEEEPKK